MTPEQLSDLTQVLEFTPLEFETNFLNTSKNSPKRLEFTPLEFETAPLFLALLLLLD